MLPVVSLNPQILDCVLESEEDFIQEFGGILDELETTAKVPVKEFRYDAPSGVYFHVPQISTKFNHVAAFDLDWTLAFNEKALYPKDPEDIQIIPGRRRVLLTLILGGYNVVIFTNQKAKSKKEKENKVARVKKFCELLSLPVYVFIATEDNEYRKPGIGMWKMFEKLHGEEIKKVMFIGDALGRPQDFSDSDILFGKGIHADVYSPEDFFPSMSFHSDTPQKEMIILVGMPGSGKSTFSKTFQSHIHLSKDILKTKFKKTLETTLQSGKSVIIDATNSKGRGEYHELAQKFGYDVKTVYIIRNGHGWNALRSKEEKVPDIAYHVYFKNLESPLLEEGAIPVWF